jgi:putative ABC transport system permease protein
MINETFARAMFPNENPIGRRLRFKGGGTRDSATIIGVVGDVRHVALATPPEAEFFLSARQFPQGAMAIVARTAGDPTRSARAIYDRVAAVDRGVPISDLRPLEALTTASVAQPRVVTLLLVVFAIVGIVLGAVGIYGVVNHAVTSRTREIGIRIALGAARARVAALILRDGVAHAAAGVVLGVSGALALSRMMAALVFGVSPTNPATYAAVSCVLLLTAAVASYLPARRAARVDPVTALRSE